MRASALALLVVLAGCDTSGPVTAPPAASVIPLEVGASWTLRHVETVRYDDAGAPASTTAPSSPSEYTLVADRDTTVAGERWVRITAPRGLGHCVFADTAWYATREAGLYRWGGSAAEPELVYATGTDPSEPFLDTPVVEAVLADPEAAYALPSGTVVARRYDRTWKRVEVRGVAEGPIAPTVGTTDHLSEERGLVALEVSYTRRDPTGADTFVPASVSRYELVAVTLP